jgi:cell division protein FtsN
METNSAFPQAQEKRTITLTLRLPTILGCLAVIGMGLIFVFILGIVLGRGYNIGDNIPALQAMLPENAPPAPPLVLADDEPRPDPTPKAPVRLGPEPLNKAPVHLKAGGVYKNATGEAGAAKSAGNADAPQPGSAGVIDQADLDYRASLKSGPQTGTDKPQKDKKAAEDKKKSDDAAKKKADDKKKAEDRKKAETAARPVEKKDKKASKDGRFHYVYQAAAYRDKDSADRYTATLRKDGVNARTERSEERGVTWFRVVIDFTGTPDETDSLRAGMRDRGVPKILLKSKISVD